MSQDDVLVVREIYRAFAQHRFPADLLSEDFVWETAPDQPGGGSHRGHDAVRAYFRDWVGGWQEVESNVERLIDRGDRIVALVHGRYRLSTEGEPLEARYAHVWRLRSGKAIHARVCAPTVEELGFSP